MKPDGWMARERAMLQYVVYGIHDANDELVYIGSTNNIANRLCCHLLGHGTRAPQWAAWMQENAQTVDFRILETHASRQSMIERESQLIRQHRPRFNYTWPNGKGPYKARARDAEIDHKNALDMHQHGRIFPPPDFQQYVETIKKIHAFRASRRAAQMPAKQVAAQSEDLI